MGWPRGCRREGKHALKDMRDSTKGRVQDTLVTETNHAKWNEVPVSSITIHW